MKFDSYAQLFLFTLDKLNNVGLTHTHPKLIQRIRKMILDHETSIVSLRGALSALEGLSLTEREHIDKLLSTLPKVCIAPKSSKLAFENPLARQIETAFAISCFEKISKQHMLSLKPISNNICVALSQLGEPLLSNFLQALTKRPFNIRSFSTPPTLQAIKTVLGNNDLNDFSLIMCIHFAFARKLLRKAYFELPTENIFFGKTFELLKKYEQHYNITFNRKWLSPHFAHWLMDKVICKQPFYIAHSRKGYKGRYGYLNEYLSSNKLGLLLPHQDGIGLKHLIGDSWCPDAIAQKPILDHPFVSGQTRHEGVYVSGPSGMASLGIGLMALAGNFSSIEDQQGYLICIVNYLTAGGFHSFHEVIGIADAGLGLLPGYHSMEPHKYMSKPPNYSLYFDMMQKVIPGSRQAVEDAWKNIMATYENFHKPDGARISRCSTFIKKRKLISPSIFSRAVESSPSVNVASELQDWMVMLYPAFLLSTLTCFLLCTLILSIPRGHEKINLEFQPSFKQ